jgi:hypothetical protein
MYMGATMGAIMAKNSGKLKEKTRVKKARHPTGFVPFEPSETKRAQEKS